MRRLILPKIYLNHFEAPLIFLVGPIKGAPFWQDKAIELIHSQNPEIYVVSPSNKVRPEYIMEQMTGDNARFLRQTLWERYYLELAAKKGSIVAFLPKEVEHLCGHAYARDTRGELGEFRGIMRYDKKFPLVIGAEKGFDGFSVLKDNFSVVCPGLKFFSSLEETCSEGVKLAIANFS